MSSEARGFNVNCPRCGEGGLHLPVADMDRLTCTECNEEFEVESLRDEAQSLVALCDWIMTAPKYNVG